MINDKGNAVMGNTQVNTLYQRAVGGCKAAGGILLARPGAAAVIGVF